MNREGLTIDTQKSRVAVVTGGSHRAVALQLDVADTVAFPRFVGLVKEALSQTWQRERFDPRYMAKELAPRGIAVNTIAPGPVETDFNGAAVRDNAQLNAQLASLVALGRAGLPDDVGGAVAALLSDGNGWITGQRIEVSGGTLL